MKAKKYILSLAMVYMAYFTHGIQAIILSQNQVNFYTQWGYTDAVEGAAAVSLAITATGFGKMLTELRAACSISSALRDFCSRQASPSHVYVHSSQEQLRPVSGMHPCIRQLRSL